MDCDILVMGAGPAGSAAGTFLARAGFRVIMVDSGHHPRHHIGESLLPGSMPILAELGIDQVMMRQRYQPKYGARFYDLELDHLSTFQFIAESGDGFPPSYQVLREDLDALLARCAVGAGCQLLEDAPIETVDAGGVDNLPAAVLADGRKITAKFLVDATGRAALLSAKAKDRTMLTDFGRIAVYNYFTDLPPHDDRDADYITMYVFNGGWYWLIPLRDGRTSVGVVLHKDAMLRQATPEEQFWGIAERMPRLASRLRAAKATDPYRVNADYSYKVTKKFGPRHVLVGDAGGFLDPVFSSGVHLALSSARQAAKGVGMILQGAGDDALREYQSHMEYGFSVFQVFVHRFYNRDLVRNLFMAKNQPAEIHRAIINILAGHVWDQSNPVIRMIMPPRQP